MKTKATLLFIALLCLAQVGCMSLRDQLIKQGYNTQYVDGFVHGDSSGQNAAGAWTPFIKNTYRYESDSQYRQGWNDGYDRAKSQYQSMQHDFLH